MTLFWIGIIIFFTGSVIRYLFKSKFYKAYIKASQTEHDIAEVRHKYRPMIILGGMLQIIGCIVGMGSFF